MYSTIFLQELRLSSVSVRLEILNCQKKWFEELAGLGEDESISYGLHLHNVIFTNRPFLKFQFNFRQDKILRW